MNLAIGAKNLSVTKDKKVILNTLSLAIKPGTITGLIGPSGSGKTTLMRTIVGVQKYAGSLEILGFSAGAKSLRSKIGYTAQTPAVYGDLTVKQNLTYFASIAGVSKKEVSGALRTVQLSQQTDQLVDSLSGGQRARVSLAIALLGGPDLLVFDEPTVGLDPILRNELWQTFSELAAAGKTLLISSHVMDEADRCDELILMREGKILWNDSRRELLSLTKSNDVGAAFVRVIEGVK